TCRRVGRYHQQRDAETVLVVAFRLRQNSGLLVVVPAAPIVPRDEDGGVLPVSAVIVAGGTGADGVDDRRHPRGAAAVVGIRVVRVHSGGNHPAHRTEITIANVLEHIGRRKIHIAGPILPGALAAGAARQADMLDGVGSRPDGAGAGRVVSPG